jgi:hypothetical protein
MHHSIQVEANFSRGFLKALSQIRMIGTYLRDILPSAMPLRQANRPEEIGLWQYRHTTAKIDSRYVTDSLQLQRLWLGPQDRERCATFATHA